MKLTFEKARVILDDTVWLQISQHDDAQAMPRRRYLVADDIAVDVIKVPGSSGGYLIEDILLSEYTGDILAVSGKSAIFGGSSNVKHYLNTFFKTTKSSKQWVEDKRKKLRSNL